MTIRLRRGTSALWASRNPVLQQGEPGMDTTTGQVKVGDGVTAWSTLTGLLSSALGLSVKEGGGAAKMGTAILVAGTVVVPTTAVTANTRVFVSAQAAGGTPGVVAVSARTAGTSFTLTSSNAADTSTVAWLLVEPTA